MISTAHEHLHVVLPRKHACARPPLLLPGRGLHLAVHLRRAHLAYKMLALGRREEVVDDEDVWLLVHELHTIAESAVDAVEAALAQVALEREAGERLRFFGGHQKK